MFTGASRPRDRRQVNQSDETDFENGAGTTGVPDRSYPCDGVRYGQGLRLAPDGEFRESDQPGDKDGKFVPDGNGNKSATGKMVPVRVEFDAKGRNEFRKFVGESGLILDAVAA